MNKNEEHLVFVAVGLFLLWWVMQSSRLPTTPGLYTGASTSGGLLGSLTNFLNGAGNLFRGIGGTPAAVTTSPDPSTVASTTIGADDLAPVAFG